LQNSTQRFSEELQLNTGEYVGAERPPSVSPTAGEERVESDGSRKSSVSSRGRYKPTVEEETRGMDFTWTAITPENLALMEERELMKALQARNKGENDKVPGWLLDGLSKVAGPVDWLVKVDIPAGVKKGKKVKFICNNVEVETTYEGSSKSTGKGEVYVMQARVNKMAGREFVWVDIPAAQLEPLSQLEIMRHLERRNHGVRDDVPTWLLHGLNHLDTVDWILPVQMPEKVKKGQKVYFTLNGDKVKAVYNGESSQATTHNVFALLGRGKLPKSPLRMI